MTKIIRLDALTGARFFAALLVFGLHSGYFLQMTGFYREWLSRGYAGVTFFFILSGFILTVVYGGRMRQAGWRHRFFGARVARIYPIALLTFLVAVPPTFHKLGPLGIHAVLTAFLNVLLLQSWDSSPRVFFAFNAPAWSLSDELFFYIVFALFLLDLVMRIQRMRTVVAVVFAIMAGEATVTYLIWSMTHSVFSYYIYIFPPTRLLEFALGMVLGRAFVLSGTHGAPRRGVFVWFGLAASGMALFLPPPGFLRPLSASFVFVPGFAALIWGLASPHSAVGGALARPFMVRLGEESYAFYLWHQLIFRYVYGAFLVFHWNPDELEAVVLVLAIFVATLVVARLSYRHVEVPWRLRIRGWVERLVDRYVAGLVKRDIREMG